MVVISVLPHTKY